MKTVMKSGFYLALFLLPILLQAKPTNANGWSTKLALKGDSIYRVMELKREGLSKAAFQFAWKGYCILKKRGMLERTNVLTICDFSQSSRNKRMYIIDLIEGQLLLKTYVAHGRNSGTEFARRFSNRPESHQSSLGFYVTRATYFGEHGLSLRITGLERGFNDRALSRKIVVHGAQYTGPDFLESNKVCGRSYGCPAVPDYESEEVIETIKNGTCLFIYHPTKKYLIGSRILNTKGV